MIDKVYIFERRKWGKKRSFLRTCLEFFKFTSKIRDCNFDLIIDLQGLLRSGLITFLSGAKNRIGLSDAREGSRLFLNHVVNVPDKKMHAVDRYLLVCNEVGVSNQKPVKFSIFIKEEIDRKVEKLFSEYDVNEDDILVAVNPNSRWQSKCWSPDRFARLSDKLIDKYDVKIIMIGAAGDREYVEKIVGMMKNTPLVLVGKTTLLELASVLKKTDIMITNDSGPMHMSVAVGTPTIALFGPTDPIMTGPYGKNSEVLFERIECQPCFKRNCSIRECMDLIDVEDVIDTFEKTLKNKSIKKRSHGNRQRNISNNE